MSVRTDHSEHSVRSTCFVRSVRSVRSARSVGTHCVQCNHPAYQSLVVENDQVGRDHLVALDAGARQINQEQNQ